MKKKKASPSVLSLKNQNCNYSHAAHSVESREGKKRDVSPPFPPDSWEVEPPQSVLLSSSRKLLVTVALCLSCLDGRVGLGCVTPLWQQQIHFPWLSTVNQPQKRAVGAYVCVSHTHTHTEREREREREKKKPHSQLWSLIEVLMWGWCSQQPWAVIQKWMSHFTGSL